MRNNVCKKLEGWAVHNPCMPTSVEMFFSGSHDTYKKGMPENNKELCEAYIQKHHPSTTVQAVKATLIYEMPEDKTYCNKGKKCGDNICFCDEK